LSAEYLEARELELNVWEDRELLDFKEIVLWSDMQLLAYSRDELNFSNSST